MHPKQIADQLRAAKGRGVRCFAYSDELSITPSQTQQGPYAKWLPLVGVGPVDRPSSAYGRSRRTDSSDDLQLTLSALTAGTAVYQFHRLCYSGGHLSRLMVDMVGAGRKQRYTLQDIIVMDVTQRGGGQFIVSIDFGKIRVDYTVLPERSAP